MFQLVSWMMVINSKKKWKENGQTPNVKQIWAPRREAKSSHSSSLLALLLQRIQGDALEPEAPTPLTPCYDTWPAPQSCLVKPIEHLQSKLEAIDTALNLVTHWPLQCVCVCVFVCVFVCVHVCVCARIQPSKPLSYPTGRCTYRLFILVYVQ